MLPFALPEYPELHALSAADKQAVVPVSTGTDHEVEDTIRRAFVYAVETCSSDVHICAHGERKNPEIKISIRAPGGLINFRYAGGGRLEHFQVKMFNLTNTTQGGTTPPMLSTRFSMDFPADWAIAHGLQPVPGMKKYNIDVRVEYKKTFEGYGFTCRNFLNPQRSPELHELGLTQALLATLKKVIAPSGLILVSYGPTGSGKTTTLYAIMRYLNNGQQSIFTIEDPVEFTLRGDGPITQIQVDGEVTFARGLRSGLRSNPDIILIGEIRDTETMEIALQAGQTGHLVLASIHANSGTETISRALDLTLDKTRDASRLADTLKFVMAQRLVNKHEPAGVERRMLTNDEKAWMKDNGIAPMHFIDETASTMTCGKVPVIEAIQVDYPIKQVIQAEGLTTDKIYRLASTQLQYETLVMAGISGRKRTDKR